LIFHFFSNNIQILDQSKKGLIFSF
jgi:hypothetical protein